MSETTLAYRCRSCGSDNITEAETVWTSTYITPAGPSYDDREYGDTDSETVPAGELAYDCRSCHTTEDSLAALVEIVELDENDEVIRVVSDEDEDEEVAA